MTFFGLRPKGYDPENKIIYNEDNNSLMFGAASSAYADKGVFSEKQMPETEELSIEAVLTSEHTDYPQFMCIVLAYAENSDDQLLIGQWNDLLVIMNGDDYSNKQRRPKIYARLNNADKVHIIISSDGAGTSAYINGDLVVFNEEFRLQLPSEAGKTRLILGNSILNQNQWFGELYALAFYHDAFDGESAKKHFTSWNSGGRIINFKEKEPYFIFNLDHFDENVVTDNTDRNAQIILPDKRPMHKTEVLSFPGGIDSADRQLHSDILINFAGFIPFGFCLFALLASAAKKSSYGQLIITILLGFLLSLLFELIQVQMPSRNSSLLDLLLNTAGTTAGAVTGWIIMKKWIFLINRKP